MLVRGYVVGALLVTLASCGYVSESQFTLTMESRLPKFIDPSGTQSPKGYTARVEFYDSHQPVRVIVTDPKHHTVFDQRGTFRWHPSGPQPGQGKLPTYPQYTVVSFPSGEDIFEQRAAEPVLYLCDDAALWSSRSASNQAMQSTASPRTASPFHD